MIKCEICGCDLKQIHWKHLKQHGLSFQKYKEMFPDSPTISQETSQLHSKAMAGREITWNDKISDSLKVTYKENPDLLIRPPLSEESRKKISNTLKGHFVSEETRQKIGQSGIGRIPWNKGLTKDDDHRLKSISEKNKQNSQNISLAIRQKISQTLKDKYANGMKIPNAKTGFRSDLACSFRSTWEANYARYLNYIGENWTYEQYKFPMIIDEKLICVYTPDFEVNSNYIEIKGHAESSTVWTCSCKRCIRDKERIGLMLRLYPDIPLILVGRAEYKELSEKYANLIAGWEKTSRG